MEAHVAIVIVVPERCNTYWECVKLEVCDKA